MPHDIMVPKTCLYCDETSKFELWEPPVCNPCIFNLVKDWKDLKIKCSTLEDQVKSLSEQVSLLNETKSK